MVRWTSLFGKFPGMKGRMYPILVEIKKPRADGVFETLPDRARKVKFIHGGKGNQMKSWQLNLLYEKVDIQLPSNYHFEIDFKGKQKIYLLNPEPGVYIPLKPTVKADAKELESILQGQGRMAWMLGTIKKNILDINVSDKWEKWIPVISLGILGTIIVFSMLFYAQGLEKQMALMGQVSSSLERVAGIFEKIAQPP